MMEKLSQILWRERELMTSLLFKLEMEQLVLSAGRTRWLGHAAKEVELVLELLRETELLRAVAADETAATLGLTSNPSLRALAEAVEEPWRTILVDHRDAFVSITRELQVVAEGNRELLSVGLRSARETLLSIEEESHGYRPDGAVLTAKVGQHLVDRSL